MIKLIRFFFRLQKKVLTLLYTQKIRIQVAKIGKSLKVNGKSSAHANTFLGNNVNFNGIRIEGFGKVIIGDNFHSGPECLIISSYHNFDSGKSIPYDNTYIHKEIIIEDNVWLGSRVVIVGGVTIGEGAIIQAGSVVVNSIPKYGIAGGAPAKVFKYRDANHYEKLKAKKLFH